MFLGDMIFYNIITVYKYKYAVSLEQARASFRPGSPFTGTLSITYHNKVPAKNVNMLIRVKGVNETYERNYTSNMDGKIIFSFDTNTSSALKTLIVSIPIN